MYCTVGLEPLSLTATSSVSRNSPNSRVNTSIWTGMNCPWRRPTCSSTSFKTVAVLASCR